MTMNKLRTTIEINTGGLDDYEVPVEIEYSVYPGCKATSVSPAEEATATLDRITVIEANGDTYGADWLVTLLADDEELLSLCLIDWQEGRIAAEEDRADALREEWMLRHG